jgi:hypothetical protein
MISDVSVIQPLYANVTDDRLRTRIPYDDDKMTNLSSDPSVHSTTHSMTLDETALSNHTVTHTPDSSLPPHVGHLNLNESTDVLLTGKSSVSGLFDMLKTTEYAGQNTTEAGGPTEHTTSASVVGNVTLSSTDAFDHEHLNMSSTWTNITHAPSSVHTLLNNVTTLHSSTGHNDTEHAGHSTPTLSTTHEYNDTTVGGMTTNETTTDDDHLLPVSASTQTYTNSTTTLSESSGEGEMVDTTNATTITSTSVGGHANVTVSGSMVEDENTTTEHNTTSMFATNISTTTTHMTTSTWNEFTNETESMNETIIHNTTTPVQRTSPTTTVIGSTSRFELDTQGSTSISGHVQHERHAANKHRWWCVGGEQIQLRVPTRQTQLGCRLCETGQCDIQHTVEHNQSGCECCKHCCCVEQNPMQLETLFTKLLKDNYINSSMHITHFRQASRCMHGHMHPCMFSVRAACM